MVASLIHFCYVIGYLRYLYTFPYYIFALISCRKQSELVVSEEVALDHFLVHVPDEVRV
jgi:hypothetical protein